MSQAVIPSRGGDRPRIPDPVLLPARGPARTRDPRRALGAGEPVAVRARFLRPFRRFADDAATGPQPARAGGPDHRHKGRGTFVDGSRPRSWLLQSSGGFFEEEVGRMGREVSSSVLGVVRGPLPGWACDSLALPIGSAGVTIERIRSVEGLKAMYVVNCLPERVADAVESLQADESLYRAPARGVRPAGGRGSPGGRGDACRGSARKAPRGQAANSADADRVGHLGRVRRSPSTAIRAGCARTG